MAAASGLDHLKNDYRRRFCRSSRVPDINTGQGQNMLEILQDCFEEKDLTNDFSINSTKSVLYSTPKVKNSSIPLSLSEEKSHPKSVPVSSRKKEAPLQDIVEPSETANKSVQAHEDLQKRLTTNIASKNTPDLQKMASKKSSVHNSEAEEEFYLSVGSPAVLSGAKTSVSQNTISSLAQKRDTYTFRNSVNMLSSSTEISLKTKKRLNFEDNDILKKVEIENKVSEVEDIIPSQQERKPSETFQKRVQDLEYESQPQTKKSFSALFLETVKRKSEYSPIVSHIATVPPHSSPSNDTKLLEDEFIIDESDRSFTSRSWITIPRKGGPLKQPIVSSAESITLLQGEKTREKHHNVSSKTLTSDRPLLKAHPEQKLQTCDEKTQSRSSVLKDELENNYRSTTYEMCSENAEKPPRNKKTIKQKQRRKLKAKVVEEQLELGKSKGENINTSRITQDRLRRNSDRNLENYEDTRNGRISKKQMLPVGDKKKNSSTKDGKEDSRKKCFSKGPKKNKLSPEEVTINVMRSSSRVSRRPSNWWVVKSEESPVHGSSSVKTELSVYDKTRQKTAKKKSHSSKNIAKKPIPSKKQKTATQGSSRVQKSLNVKDSERIISHEKISSCSQNEPSDSEKADLARKKSLDHSGTTGCFSDQSGDMTAQNAHLMSHTNDHPCKTQAESNLYCGKPKTSVLDESGPSRLKNYLMAENNSDVGGEQVPESLGDSKVKRSKVASEKKIHHKLILPSNTPNVRRTKRIRLKPLEYWRGERIDYQETPSGGFVIGGILSPDTVSSKRKAKGNMGKVNKLANRKRICLDNDEGKNRLVVNMDIPLGDPLQPTRVKDPETREVVLMDLIRPRNTYQFFVEHGELKVYKTLDTPFFSTGKLILGPYEEKGKQHVGQDILVFYVDFGDLLCTLHESPYIITTGDSFYVPAGNYYNIRNLLNEESVLLFTQIKR